MTAPLYRVLGDTSWSPHVLTTATITHPFLVFSAHVTKEKLKDLSSVQLSQGHKLEVSVTVTDAKTMILLERQTFPLSVLLRLWVPVIARCP